LRGCLRAGNPLEWKSRRRFGWQSAGDQSAISPPNHFFARKKTNALKTIAAQKNSKKHRRKKPAGGAGVNKSN
jgi:hypothetical protein